jgi:hypothetical protein
VANFKLLSKRLIAGLAVSITGGQPRFKLDTFLFIYLFHHHMALQPNTGPVLPFLGVS